MSTKNKKILILGGCGYVGSYLTSYLYKKGYDITVFDTQWFGKNISKNIKVKIIKGDVRDIEKISFKGFHSIIHLANIANDPSVALNPTLSWEVNVFSSYLIIKKAANEGVKNFIYGSSGSVYGIKKEKKVTEDLDLKPISIYNKTKMIAERIFMSFDKDIKIFSIRPATVCGFSPRMRLDVTVNLLTFQALTNKEMTRFNITLNESIDLVLYAIKNSLGNEIFIPKIPSYRIMDLAKSISEKCKIKILGIRPGEKIHEEMITVNDSFNTIENSKYYIILPSLQKATINKYLKYYKAQKINKPFSYNSKDNKKFLNVKEIKELIQKNIS